MRVNAFNELYCGPEDDLDAELDARGLSTDFYARVIEEVPEGDGPVAGWGCELADNDDGETVAYLEGFESEDALRDFLRERAVTVS